MPGTSGELVVVGLCAYMQAGESWRVNWGWWVEGGVGGGGGGWRIEGFVARGIVRGWRSCSW